MHDRDNIYQMFVDGLPKIVDQKRYKLYSVKMGWRGDYEIDTFQYTNGQNNSGSEIEVTVKWKCPLPKKEVK